VANNIGKIKDLGPLRNTGGDVHSG